MYYRLGLDILRHRNVKQFEKKKVTQAVLDYVKQGMRLSKDPEFLDKIPENRKNYFKTYSPSLYLVAAMAYLNEESPEKSMEELKSYNENEGVHDKTYHYVLASTLENLGNTKEAFESYLDAAADNFEDSLEKAKELYSKLNGSPEGFETMLEAKLRELPFHPEHFKPEEKWQGKTVLAELFTGSECPPCVAADLGFDGLIDAYDSKYLVILEYHLPIPRPDPIMNEATNKRAEYYGANSTPSTFFDGEKKRGGGGGRDRAELKFNQYTSEINSRVYEKPEVTLKVSAKLKGDDVQVEYSADKKIDNVDFNIALVQNEEKYAGSNGIVFHKLVVREFITVESSSGKSLKASINIQEAEKAGEKRLADYEKEISFQFKEKHFKIDRSDLKIVFFVQDKESKKVYNAAVCDVK
jgi:thiol-disulfide isomerase/thioredoxin